MPMDNKKYEVTCRLYMNKEIGLAIIDIMGCIGFTLTYGNMACKIWVGTEQYKQPSPYSPIPSLALQS